MSDIQDIERREAGLSRKLSSKQLSMIALGGAIGTGLFLGSKSAIGLAGPSVVLSYIIGAAIALLLMGALAEMVVANPTTGSFGSFAEIFLGPLFGFLVRYAYWSSLVLAIGAEVTAIGQYMQVAVPSVPSIVWVVVAALSLVLVNSRSVNSFGSVEYWLSTIKIFAIIGFIVIASIVVVGRLSPESGLQNFIGEGGFFAGGLSGLWFAAVVSIFSYMSIEMIAIAAGEAKDPGRAMRTAFRVTFLRLLLFYVLSLSLVVALAPVSQILSGGSPFVNAISAAGIPFAEAILNMILIVAALSAMNSQLYAATRMIFSLSRNSYAPKTFGKLNSNEVPFNAVLLSVGGVSVAIFIYLFFPSVAFEIMMSLSIFGALFTWFIIFCTHLMFRQRVRRSKESLGFKLRIYPLASWVGAVAMLAAIVTTAFIPGFSLALIFGIPFIVFLALSYLALDRSRKRKATETVGEASF